jgi:hypothetical protein
LQGWVFLFQKHIIKYAFMSIFVSKQTLVNMVSVVNWQILYTVYKYCAYTRGLTTVSVRKRKMALSDDTRNLIRELSYRQH